MHLGLKNGILYDISSLCYDFAFLWHFDNENEKKIKDSCRNELSQEFCLRNRPVRRYPLHIIYDKTLFNRKTRITYFICSRFLEEYRILQKELTKMKETCVTLCQEKDQVQVTPVTPLTPSSVISKLVSSNSKNFALSPNSNVPMNEPQDFQNYENEITKYFATRNISSNNFQTDV